MKKYILLFSTAVCVVNAYAQDKKDTATFLLHKFEQKIGKESYTITRTANTVTYAINFKFTDRGSPVALKAELAVTPAAEPISLVIKGKVARSASIDDSISIVGSNAISHVDDSTYKQALKPLTFPVASYAPGTVQQVLLQYWKKHNEPASITTLPFGSVQIKRSGTDELPFNGKTLQLDRYTIGGLIWGNEILWTDHSGNLICLITNDAEADKLEMMAQAYETLLPTFIAKAAIYGMELFAKSTPKMTAANKVIMITGGTVVDVVNSKTIPNATVVIENGIIKSIGGSQKLTNMAGVTVIDAKGKTILPGLWDMHAHFEQVEWGPAYLAAGVTTVRDCGNEFSFINAIQSAIDGDKGVGPKILKAGIIDGKGPEALGIIQADTKEEAIKEVDRYKDNGFVQIKIYSSVKPAIVKAICDEAHRLGLTVTGHIPDRMTLRAGVDSGMDMVNHVQYVFSMMKINTDRSVNFDDPKSIAAIKFIKDHNVVIDPTIGVFEMIYRSTKDDITIMEPAFYTLPLPLQTIFKDTGQPPLRAAIIKPIYTSMLKLVKVLYDAGVTIVAGTDQGFPGYSLDRELELYVQSGLTPIQAIRTATITPAMVMKMDKETGSIEPGKHADLVIIDGDPLTNIRDIRKVTTVIKGGVVYDPLKMHQLVGFSK